MNVITKPELRAGLFIEGRQDGRGLDPRSGDGRVADLRVSSASQAPSQAASRDLETEKIEQIRDLLFGDFKRLNDARFSMLDARLHELEAGVHRRLEALQTRLEALSGEVGANQRSAFDDLARGVADLSQLVKRIAKE